MYACTSVGALSKCVAVNKGHLFVLNMGGVLGFQFWTATLGSRACAVVDPLPTTLHTRDCGNDQPTVGNHNYVSFMATSKTSGGLHSCLTLHYLALLGVQ